jgi:hypothetical protein
MLTQNELKDRLHYSPETGVFTWINSKSKNLGKTGDIAGGDNGCGYIKIHVLGKSQYAHRLAFLYMTGKFPNRILDHINEKKNDNRWINLRMATNSQNMCNQGKPASNTSGVKGVTWDKVTHSWKAQCRVNGVVKNLGRYQLMSDAIAIRQSVAKNAQGNFYKE